MRARAAWLVVAVVGSAVVAACSGGGGGGGGGNTPTPTASGNVVRVFDSNGDPLPGIDVVVNDSAGEVASTTQTGTDGTVPVTVPPLGSVTVLDITVDGHESQTVVAPPLGATLTFQVAVAATPTPTPPTTTISATFTAPAGVSSIAWFANCSSFPIVPYSAGVMSQQIQAACTTNQAVWNLLAIGRNGGGTPIAWTRTLDQPNSFGGTLEVALDLSNTAFDTVSVGHAALPVAGDSHATFAWFADSAGLLRMIAIPYSPALPSSAAPVATSVPVPQDAASWWSPAVDVLMLNPNSTSTYLRQEWKVAGSVASAYTLDPASHVQVAIGFLNTTDPSRLVVSWTPDAGPRGVAAFGSIEWSTGAEFGVRHFTLPADGPVSFTVPKLPASAAAWSPVAGSTYLKWSAGYDDVDVIADYAGYLTIDRATLPSFTRYTSSGSAP